MRICRDTRTLEVPKKAGDPVSGKYCHHRRYNKKCKGCKDVIQQSD